MPRAFDAKPELLKPSGGGSVGSDPTGGSHEVASKRKAAQHRNIVDSFGVDDVQWRYLLLSERDVDDAQGSREFLAEG